MNYVVHIILGLVVILAGSMYCAFLGGSSNQGAWVPVNWFNRVVGLVIMGAGAYLCVVPWL